MLKHSPIALAALFALEAFAQPAPTQLPVLRPGGAVINATVAAPAGNALTVTQTTSANNRGLVEWTSFSIGASARVNIVQPNAQSVLVNRVMGGPNGVSASEIYGGLSANGRVFLVNPGGVVFGPGAQVNVGSLVASSLDLDSSMTANNYAGFMAGNQVLLSQGVGGTVPGVQVLPADDPRRPQIQVTEGGSIVLISRDQVVQGGSITAPGGRINLSTGTAATLLPVGNSGFVEVLSVVPAASRSGGVTLDSGSQTVASGGSVIVGGQPGEETARGDIISVAGLVSADSATGNAGSVRIDAGSSGSIIASEGAVVTASSTSGTGGQLGLLGNDIALQRGDVAHPRLLAEGSAGGGSITLGNTATRAITIEQGSLVSADATDAGNGGSIAVRALFNNPNSTSPVARIDFGVTEVYGSLRSRGGTRSGNGGSIETSGLALATSLTDPFSGTTQSASIDARARTASGSAGTWTLDPFDVTISNAAPVAINGSFNPTGPGANVRAADLSAALDGGTSIDISTEAGGAGTAVGNITIAAGTTITRSTGTAATSFTLRANNSIFADGTVIDASAAGPLNVNFYSDLDGNGSGGINLQAGRIATGGGNLTLSGGIDPSTGYARGDAQNAGVTVTRTAIDTRASTGGAGNVVIRGQAGSPSGSPGVALNADMILGNLTVDGRASHSTAVLLNGSDITTTAGTIDVRGVATRPDAITGSLAGIDTGTLRVQLGSGSMTLAGRGDDANLVAGGNATGLRIGDLLVSAAPTSTGRITLAGQAAGGSVNAGISAGVGSNTGLVISSNALVAGSPATGASVVIGGLGSASTPAIDLGSGTGPHVNTTGAVNLRPLGVSSTGAITEQAAQAIVLAPAAAASSAGGFALNTDWLRTPVAGVNSGIAAGQGIVVGSAAHTGAITVQDAAFTQHTGVAITLQNEGTGSQGIALGTGNTLGSLGLLTADNVTQTAGGVNLQNLVVRGGAGSNINLNAAGNQIGVLAFDPPAALTVFTQGNLTVDAASAQSFDAASGSFSPVAITNSLGGNTALLQSAANVLINRPIGMAGAASQLDIVSPGTVTFATGAALSPGAGGRWRVWAPTVVNAGAAGAATNYYGCVFGDSATCSVSNIALPTTGNQLLRPTQPTLAVAADPATGYTDLPLPSLGYTSTGLVNGDTDAMALTGSLVATPSGPGTYAIGQGDLRSPLGYLVTYQPATLTLQPAVTRHTLQSAFLSELSSDVYGRNLDQPYICTAASVIRSGLTGEQSDPLASEWGKVRNQPQLSGCLNVTEGGQRGFPPPRE